MNVFRRALTVLACSAALAGCGPSNAPSTPPSTAPSTPGTGPATVTLDEHADRTTVTVAVGTAVRVELHSTYWQPVDSSAPQLLSPTGEPSTGVPSTAASGGPACHPGSGCGTVTGDFLARSAGSARLTATRTVCGEARPCRPDEQTYTVTVEITG